MRALVLSAGGNKSSYQVGVLKYLINELNINYDIFTGVSAGGINAAFLSQFDDAYKENAILQLEKLWLNISNENIYKHWIPFGKLHAIFKSSFFNGAPLKKLIESNIDIKKIIINNKIVTVGATSLTSGEYKVFNKYDPNFIDAVVAGASFPIMLSPVKINNEYFTDGGVIQTTPIKTAIDLGATTLDIILTNPEEPIKHNFTLQNLTVISSLKRILNLCTDQLLKLDLELLHNYNNLAKLKIDNSKKELIINIIRPNFSLVDNFLDFNKDKISKIIDIGYNDAKLQFNIETLKI